ncbi:MAG TPA: energy transducer TonB [Terracidiphilus sp.]|nr:energy transducer TonB [Terracidiphilus sp.]
MFEDSTFESTGRIRTRSRNWMIVAFACNGSILVALILFPLIHPEALSRQNLTYLIEAPDLTTHEPPPRQAPTHAFHGTPQIQDGRIFAPPQIPDRIVQFDSQEAPSGPVAMDQGPGLPNGADDVFRGNRATTVVRAAPKGPVRVSSVLVEGLLVRKVVPTYPPIARATRTQGKVILQATISKQGTIENLRVISGAPMLQQAAIDAVKQWQYKPYLLNGEPVEVETTVNVVFTMQ